MKNSVAGSLLVIGSVFAIEGTLVAEQSSSPQTVLDAVTADPAQHKVEFENDMVRVVRIRYAAGAKTPMHTHPAHCLTFLTDGHLKLTLTDNRTIDAPLTKGVVECNDAVTHAAENVGTAAIELIAFE